MKSDEKFVLSFGKLPQVGVSRSQSKVRVRIVGNQFDCLPKVLGRLSVVGEFDIEVA